MTHWRFGDHILPLCAIALLGSLALAPTHTLADGSGDDSSQAQHGSAAANSGHGDGQHDAGHDDQARLGKPSNRTGIGASNDCAEGSGDGGSNCGVHGSLGVGKGLVPAAAAPGASASAPGGAARAASSPTSRASSPASGPASSTTAVSAATRASSARAIAVVQGVNLPGIAVHVSRPPAANPATIRPPLTVPSTSAPPAARHPVLGPVPVLVPSIGVTVAPATSALGWGWLVALAIVGILLGVVILVRRRRAGASPL
ncbi:MAG: hypothetical protein ABI352_07530 [Candidatus Dormibacter sp.]